MRCSFHAKVAEIRANEAVSRRRAALGLSAESSWSSAAFELAEAGLAAKPQEQLTEKSAKVEKLTASIQVSDQAKLFCEPGSARAP